MINHPNRKTRRRSAERYPTTARQEETATLTSQAHIKFADHPHDADIIRQIVGRALGIGSRDMFFVAERMDLMMDISAVHANGNPLRLEALLVADEFNFLHDVFGIIRHIDRNTGKLTDFFSPRFTQHSK